MNGWRSLLPNAWYIAVREFRGRVRTRSFVLGTILLAVLGLVATQGSVLIDVAVSSTQTKLAVVTEASGLPSGYAALLDGLLNPSTDKNAHPSFRLTWVPSGDAATAVTDLANGKYDGVLVIRRDPASGNLAFTLRTDLTADGVVVKNISSAATMLSLSDIAGRAGTTFGAALQTSFSITPVNANSPSQSLSGQITNTLTSTILIVLIFMAIVTYGTWVAMSVAEEKSSRVMELMLNAATPLQMLAGKVIGNGVAGLLQYGIVIASVVVGLVVQGPIRAAVLGGSGGGLSLGGMDPMVFAAFLILFTGGFLLYSLLYAALGSLVSRQEDVQSATSPLMMLIMVGYFMSIFGMQAIDDTWVKVLSFVPFFSPYLMLTRVAVGHVQLWEFLLALVFMVLAIAAALVMAARIYSAGVLLYGQRVGLRQILRAARVSR